jgi:uncharacterized protein
VAVVFFDTSALARRYDQQEPGARRVLVLCSSRQQNNLFISRITRIEIASTFNRKVRDGSWDIRARDHAWRLFASHERRQYRIMAIDDDICSRAENLLFHHPLRAYDALQLVTALRVARMFAGSNVEFRFCTADRAQGAAAAAEGLVVEMIG